MEKDTQMTTSPQPNAGAVPAPQFADSNTCRHWIKALPLSNSGLAHTSLLTQLELLNRVAIAPLERLKICELLREPAAYLQREVIKRYSGKPLPPDETGMHAWSDVVALWKTLADAYRLCLQGCLESDPEVAPHIALVTHRCLRYVGLQMLEHYRIHQEIGRSLWKQAHELYALAEQQDYPLRALKDSLNKDNEATHCTAAYAQILLTDLADPYSLNAHQLMLLERWLDKWAVRATIVITPPDEASLSLVGVDLAGEAGPVIVRGAKPMAKPRYIDMDRIATTFRKRVKQIRKGDDPAALGLGEDCSQPDCEALLTSLYQHWCEPTPQKRDFSRRQGVDKAQAALGMACIHFFMGGEKPFKQPGEKEKLSKREIEDLQFFGRISDQTEKLHLSQLGFALETWHIQDESALGFRLVRQDRDGLRLSLKQLIAVRPSDSNTYALGVIKWLVFPPGEGPHIGVRVLPGAPLAIAARPVALMADAANKYAQAFLLPDMPVVRETTSLVLPTGWFSPGRLVEIHTGTEQFTAKLNKLIEKGSDFERVGFVKTQA